MASEKPPRRSRQNQEPATIDLNAVEVSSEAGPETEKTAETAAPEAAPGLVPDPAAPEPPVTEEPVATDIKAEEPAVEEASPEPPAAAPHAPAETARKGTSSVTGAVAAGIFGGLVALAGAGSMQYAGYLPSIQPVPAAAPVAPAADTSALETEIAALKSQIANLTERPATAAAADISALEARIAALEAAPAADQAAQVDIAPLEQKLSVLSGEVSQLEGSLAATEQKQETLQTSFIDRLQKMEAEVNDPSRRNAVARAIAASGLKATIDRGGAFVTELETFAGVAETDPAVAGLKPYAESGVPTRATLIADFPQAANAVLAVVNRPDPTQNWGERLWSSALSLVKVRPVGQVEGDTPEAFLARSEDALKKGDLETALAEWNRLPEEARAASDFGKALAARIEVEKLVGATLREAVTSAAGN